MFFIELSAQSRCHSVKNPERCPNGFPFVQIIRQTRSKMQDWDRRVRLLSDRGNIHSSLSEHFKAGDEKAFLRADCTMPKRQPNRLQKRFRGEPLLSAPAGTQDTWNVFYFTENSPTWILKKKKII